MDLSKGGETPAGDKTAESDEAWHNFDSESFNSTSANIWSQRQPRGSIAAQACEICRSRKHKCDEGRPKCGLCQRMNYECIYREPRPTKKDKSLVEILEVIKRLDSKLDLIASSKSQSPTEPGSLMVSPSSHSRFIPRAGEILPSARSWNQHPRYPRKSDTAPRETYQHPIASDKILSWPVIRQTLLQRTNSDSGTANAFEQNGANFLVELSRTIEPLPSIEMKRHKTYGATSERISFPTLGRTVTSRLATAYFDSFDSVYQILNQQSFFNEILVKVDSEGFGEDKNSVIALLVLSLGQMALEGHYSAPINPVDGYPIGGKGADLTSPPGLGMFTEARKRIGMIMTDCDLENVQIYCLAALYYQCCFRYKDLWRMSVFASTACKALIASNETQWHTPQGEIIKQISRHCVNMEIGLHLGLNVPLTGISTHLKDESGTFGTTLYRVNLHNDQHSSHDGTRSTSHLALQQLCIHIISYLHDPILNLNSINANKSIAALTSFERLQSTLAQWRKMLPEDLQWTEDDLLTSPGAEESAYKTFGESDTLFTKNLNAKPMQNSHAHDIHAILVRSSYYYTQYILYRPFVYRALHFPDKLTPTDAEGVGRCLHACVKFSGALSPVAWKKRLVPYLFCWSPHFLGILLILYMTEHDPTLRDIRSKFCGVRFEALYIQSKEFMLDWIRDLKDSDLIAMWCWEILESIY